MQLVWQMLQMIDTSEHIQEFRKRRQEWAPEWVQGGLYLYPPFEHVFLPVPS